MEQKVILVVCNGNIYRSPIAEYCLNRMFQKKGLSKEIFAVSRGLQGAFGTPSPRGRNLRDYPFEWSIAEPILAELGIDISAHEVTPIDLDIIKRAALIFAMERGVLTDRTNSLFRQFPQHVWKMRLFRELEGKPADVPDCYGSTDPTIHREVIELINNIIEEHVGSLLAYMDLFTE